MKKQVENGNLAFLFRYSALIIVYLLRRRAWDDEYMNPSEELACDTKSLFEEVIRKLDDGVIPILGGCVDARAALQRVIEYIDRHGKGSFLGFEQKG